MKIYISGRITGLPKDYYMEKFAIAETIFKDKGISVINPAKVNGNLPEDTTYQEYMDMSILMLSMCDTIYMLNNYKESNGANIELKYAQEHHYKILYEP